MGRAVSEDCQPASAALLHPVNPLPSITRFARLIPLPRAARCKSPLGCLLIAHEIWRLSSFSPGKFCELRDFAYGQNLYVLYAKFPPPKAKRLQLVMPPTPQGRMIAREQGVPRPKVSTFRPRHNIIIYSTLLQVSFENHNFTHINRDLCVTD